MLEILRKDAERRAFRVRDLKPRWMLKTLLDSLKGGLRMIFLKGLRGVGKTTALLQLYNHLGGVYLSADHPLIRAHGLYEVIRHFIETEGARLFLIDEVHWAEDWVAHIKTLHDTYDVRFVITGSAASALDIVERRGRYVRAEPLSFSEWLDLFHDRRLAAPEWRNEQEAFAFAVGHDLEPLFWQYMRSGGFPFSHGLSEAEFFSSLYASVIKSIREDSLAFFRMSLSKALAMEKLLSHLALSNPGELSYTSLSQKFGIGKSMLYEIINALEQLSIIRVVRPYGKTGLRADPKVLFYHPNLRWAWSYHLGIKPNLGALREEYAVFHLDLMGYAVFTVKGRKKNPDYIVEKAGRAAVVEIGGKSKSHSQLHGIRGLPRHLLTDYGLIALGFGPKPD